MWIQEKKYCFDYGDITSLAVVLAVALTICGFAVLGTIIFIINCIASLILTCIYTKRFNLLILNMALLVLNVYFIL